MKKQVFLSIFFLIVSLSGLCQDSLMYLNGKQVKTTAEWEERRVELKDLVLKHIYGYMPPVPRMEIEVKKEVLIEEAKLLYKEVFIYLFDDRRVGLIKLALFIPADREGPVPVVLALNKCGNITVSSLEDVKEYRYKILHPWCEKQVDKHGKLRGIKEDFWALDTLLNRGYAFATFHESDVAADMEARNHGVFGHYPELKNDTGGKVLSAWAWGLQRAVDYLVTDSLIDPGRIILFGHSRRGKAALLAAALDERVAMVVPHQSGTGGMALGKKHPMESMRRINKVFPHWFNDRYKTYAKKPKTLPIDQHYLLALMAPRPVIETVGIYDPWSSYWLSLKNMKMVTPVYKLYGEEGIVGKGKVKKRISRRTQVPGQLVQIRRPYRHTMNGDYWNFILDFADLRLGE